MQNKSRPALIEYMYALFMEQSKGEAPTNEKRIEQLCKEVAAVNAMRALAANNTALVLKDIPSKAYCKNFLETFPNTHDWVNKFRGVVRSDLLSHLAAQTEPLPLLSASLDVVCFDIANEAYSTAFDTLSHLANPVSLLTVETFKTPEGSKVLSLLFELSGTEKHLRGAPSKAVELYQYGMDCLVGDNNPNLSIKLAAANLELGRKEQVYI